jgi:hypothetical protein
VHEHGGSALPLISALTIAVALTAACTAHYYQAKLARLAGRRHWLNAFVESVAAILHRGSGRRADDRLLATGLHLLSLAALLLPGDSRADTLATARDVLFEATGAAPTRGALGAVVLRLLSGMLTEAVRARKRLLGGAGSGIVAALTITSSTANACGSARATGHPRAGKRALSSSLVAMSTGDTPSSMEHLC